MNTPHRGAQDTDDLARPGRACQSGAETDAARGPKPVEGRLAETCPRIRSKPSALGMPPPQQAAQTAPGGQEQGEAPAPDLRRAFQFRGWAPFRQCQGIDALRIGVGRNTGAGRAIHRPGRLPARKQGISQLRRRNFPARRPPTVHTGKARNHRRAAMRKRRDARYPRGFARFAFELFALLPHVVQVHLLRTHVALRALAHACRRVLPARTAGPELLDGASAHANVPAGPRAHACARVSVRGGRGCDGGRPPALGPPAITWRSLACSSRSSASRSSTFSLAGALNASTGASIAVGTACCPLPPLPCPGRAVCCLALALARSPWAGRVRKRQGAVRARICTNLCSPI